MTEHTKLIDVKNIYNVKVLASTIHVYTMQYLSKSLGLTLVLAVLLLHDVEMVGDVGRNLFISKHQRLQH